MPRGADNETLILDAARALFLRDGYAATSTDAVAREAGVSKATLYARFRSKDDLFVAVVTREGEELTLTLERSSGRDIATDLRELAVAAAALLLSPTVIGVHRLVAADGGRSPIAEVFYRNGPGQLNRRLAQVLADAMERGELVRSDPHLAAVQFLSVIVGDLQLRALLGLGFPSTRVRTAAAVAGADVFVRAFAPITAERVGASPRESEVS